MLRERDRHFQEHDQSSQQQCGSFPVLSVLCLLRAVFDHRTRRTLQSGYDFDILYPIYLSIASAVVTFSS